jgi:protein O-GlcNAc transferase
MNTENILDNNDNLDNNLKSLMEVAVQKHQSGQLDEAQFLYKQILKLQDQSDNQHYAIASSNLGSIFEQQGFLEAAQESYQQALSFKPDYAEAYYNLGNVQKKQGFLEAAIKSYQQALKIQPEIPQAHHNLGTVFQQQGLLEAAVESYQQALKLQPNYAQAHYNLGNVFLQQGLFNAAVQSYQQALNSKPDYTHAHHNLGNVLKLQGKLEAALKSYQQAIDLNPNYTEAHQNLGNTLYEQGNIEDAIASYHQVLKLQPDFAPAKFAITIGQLPIIYANSAEIDIKRNDYQQHLVSLVQSYKASPQQEIAADAIGTLQPFYLAYQGRNDRDLQEIYGEMITGLMSNRYPHWSQTIPVPNLQANEKIRIGFVSRFFYNHSNWKIPIQGWVENLDRNKFQLFGYYTGSKRDQETITAAKAFDKFNQGVLSLEQWCELIQEDRLHVLIFPEFGMDPMTIKLGCLRLAPVQMTSWGHPSTSGLPTMDYYLSSELMEPENAQEQYTENLVKLPNLSIYYQNLGNKQQDISKEEIGIKNHEIMFWCCQSLFKYLPENDDVFPRIVSYLSSCKFVFIKYNKGEYVTNTFEQRLNRAFGKLGLNYQDYCIFLAPMDSTRFAGITAIADVFLDSIGWSGCNSTLEALAHDIPVLTLPGDLMRGRHTMAMLKMMGVEETIAATKDDYIQMAVRLGQDADYRQQLKQLISENKYKLYEDLKPVRALENFIFNIFDQSTENQLSQDNSLSNSSESSVQLLMEIASKKLQLNKLAEAESLYKQVLDIQPNHTIAQISLAEILQTQNKLDEAIFAYHNALHLQPNSIIAAGILNNLGNIFKEQNQLERAVECYHQALQLDPNDPFLYHNLGTTVCDQGKLSAGIDAFEQALKIQPDFAPSLFGNCINQLAIIYSSIDEIELRRNNYNQHLQNLVTHYQAATPAERKNAAKAIGLIQPFYLAYQGLNDRNLQIVYGQIITQLMSSLYPQWSKPLALPQLAANEKIRIGFVSKFFYNHSNWKIPIQGWVQNLDRSEFELFAYHTDVKRDRETKKAAQLFDKFTQNSLQLEQWCELIQKDNLHILIFPEFGMDPMTLQLGCLRLAPIQITSWGHPNTSGLPTIDYYLSSDLMEPENAQEHYSEQLVRLPNLSIHYTPLAIQPQATAKNKIGIGDDEIMFWCCQSLYKYLPQHDDVFARIAFNLPKCKFVFIEAPQGQYVTEVFQQRLDNAFEALGLNYQDYCIFLPRMGTSTFAGTTASCDVFLDSIGWSGCNSTLESIAHNIPVVTLPGGLMRGRHTLAMLKMMGIEETIAATKDDYVEIAVRLGQDAQYRQRISQLIADNKQKLYGDLKPVRALEEFFFKIVNKSRRFAAKELVEIIQLAVQYQKANRLTEAEQLYHQVLEIQPNHPEALYSLGILAQQSGQPQTALKWLNAAAQVEPDVKTSFSLGNLHFAQNEFSSAAIAYRQALALRPEAIPIYNNLGYALQQQGLFDEAIIYYQKALELKPDFTEAQANLGNVLHAQGKLSSQQKLIHSQLNNKLGLQSKKALDLNTAVAYYRASIVLQPDFVEAHYNLGVALQELESDEAMACYQRVLELDPNYAQVYFNLAQYQSAHDLDKAISTYQQGLKLINPRYVEALSDRGSEITQELPITPPIPADEVQIGNQLFPAIPTQEERKRPFWTVVIPVYATQHRRQYLLRCLASVLLQWQGHSEMEILLIDDASVPPLYDLVNAIGGGIIRYYRNPQNMGAYRNFNIGVALSHGQWIHLLHDDDYVLPGFYERLKQSLENCPESVGAAFTGYENINEAGKVVFTQQVYGKYRGIATDFLQQIGVANPLNMPAVVISRKVHEHLGGYLPELNYTGDWEFYKRIAAFYDWWCEPEILARYRQHSDNITTESILSGSKGTCLRRAIEVSENYIPQEITAKSRSHHFNYCLQEAAIPLHFGKVDGALRMVREALIIDRSPESVAKLFTWLKQDKAAQLRNEIASKFI